MTAIAASPEPTLGDVLRDLWRIRIRLAVGAALGLFCGFMFLTLAIPQYRATMLVAPTTRSGTPDISALFPDNASFAMEYVLQSFGPGDSSDFMRFETIMREAAVAERLLKDEDIRQGLAQAHRFHMPSGNPPANPQQMARWLQDHVIVDPVAATRLKRISVQHPDPGFAVLLLNRIYKTTDGLIRAELVDKTQKRIAYLEKELGGVMNPEHRRILTKLLMDQEQISMIMAVGEPFAAQMAEPPYVSDRPWWPRKSVVLPVFMMVGLVLAYIAHGFRKS